MVTVWTLHFQYMLVTTVTMYNTIWGSSDVWPSWIDKQPIFRHLQVLMIFSSKPLYTSLLQAYHVSVPSLFACY